MIDMGMYHHIPSNLPIYTYKIKNMLNRYINRCETLNHTYKHVYSHPGLDRIWNVQT